MPNSSFRHTDDVKARLLCSNSAVPTCQIRGIDPTLQNSRKAHQPNRFAYIHEPLRLSIKEH
ncbi:hypothetical protein V8C26DRAFT_384601 [Trichoderma gracile]